MRSDEGGSAWLIVVGATIAHAVPFGLVVYSFTIFFPPILEEFGTGQAAAGLIVSLATALMLGASGVAGILTDRWGARRTVLVGSVGIGLGLGLASAAQSAWQVVLSYGVIAGLGSSLTFVPAVTAVGRAFERRRGLALGLAAAGTGWGTVVSAPLANALIESRGWRWALAVLAVVATLALILAASLLPDERSDTGHAGAIGELRRDRIFQLLIASSVVGGFGYWVPFFFMRPYAEAHGSTAAAAAFIVAIMGVANTLGRIVMGWVADRFGRLRIMQVSASGMAAAVFAWPLARADGSMLIFGIAYAAAAGAFIALLPALAGDYFGGDRLGMITGLIFASAALGTLLSAPVSGSIFDATGTYTVGIFVAGATLVISAIPFFLLPHPRANV